MKTIKNVKVTCACFWRENKDGSVLADSISGSHSLPRSLDKEGVGEEGHERVEVQRNKSITSLLQTLVECNTVISFQLLFFLHWSAGLGNANGCSLPWVFYRQWRVIIFGNNQYWIVKPRDKVARRAFKQSLTSVGLKADGWISWDWLLEGLLRQTRRVTSSHLPLP